MVARATVAGILGLVSLLIPLEVVVFPWGSVATWTILGVDVFSTGNYWYNVTQFTTIDQVLDLLILAVVLVGAILLLALRGRPKIGSELIASGVAFYIIDLVYDELTFPTYGFPVPLGFFLLLAASLAMIGPARTLRMRRRYVAVLVVGVAIFFVFVPAVPTTTSMTPHPAPQGGLLMPYEGPFEGATFWRGYESPSCAVFGLGFGDFGVKNDNLAILFYQLGCPPRYVTILPVPASYLNGTIMTVSGNFTSVSVTTTSANSTTT